MDSRLRSAGETGYAAKRRIPGGQQTLEDMLFGAGGVPPGVLPYADMDYADGSAPSIMAGQMHGGTPAMQQQVQDPRMLELILNALRTGKF